MSGELQFRDDLYRGTAPYYDRYRPQYPADLFDDLRARLPVSGRGQLLDLACGTGQIALPLAGHFATVTAVDQEAESVAYGRAKADALGITNITWMTGTAETVALHGPFELICIGNAFHRLNRQLVAARMSSWLQAGGGVALVWGDGPWPGERRWQRIMDELVREWVAKVGAADRVPAGWEAAIVADPHEAVLRRAGLDYVGKFPFTVEHDWTLDTLTGFVYSTSALSGPVLGEKAAEFERDMAERLRAVQPDGAFHQSISFAYELAVRTD